MTEPIFDIRSGFIFPTGTDNSAIKIHLEHKIQICNTIQMGNLLLVEDPNVRLTDKEINKLIISERIYLN